MTGFNKFLFGTVAVAALGLGAPVANATQLGFAPGAPSAAASNNEFIPGADTILDTHVLTDVYDWTLVNNDVNNPPANTLFGTQEWGVNITLGLGGALNSGDIFFEDFSFNLARTCENSVSGVCDTNFPVTTYGAGLNTHVIMSLSAAGTIANHAVGADLLNGTADDVFSLVYSSAFFTMSVDADGLVSTTGDRTDLATFGSSVFAGSQSTIFPDSNGAFRGNLNWNVSWDSAATGVWTLGGNEITDGGLGLRPLTGASMTAQSDVVRTLDDATVGEGTGDILQYTFITDSLSTGSSIQTVTVPEPVTLGLLGAGLIGLGAVARRRRSA